MFFRNKSNSHSKQGELLYKLLTENSDWLVWKNDKGLECLYLKDRSITVYGYDKILISIDSSLCAEHGFNNYDNKIIKPLIRKKIQEVKDSKIISALRKALKPNTCSSEERS